MSRATKTTFFAGFPIAFFSGLGVALSVLDDQTSNLVGVAISASLLPPAGVFTVSFLFPHYLHLHYSHPFLIGHAI